MTVRNPDFDIDQTALEAEIARMSHDPRALERPVVVLGGWHSPGVANWSVESVVRSLTSAKADDFLSITYPLKWTLQSAAGSVLEAMRRRGIDQTEVDLIGISMGGVIARGLAAGMFGQAPLRVCRIFTLATPHRGAKITRVVCPDPCAWAMRPDSRFLERLNAERNGGHELFCYGVLRDWWIGAPNTAPPGMHPYWLDAQAGLWRLCSHLAINHERRVTLDIARRLRGEEPIAKRATPPPRD
jgi:pimeloyl-ACP methyl ester carboxylesterase